MADQIQTSPQAAASISILTQADDMVSERRKKTSFLDLPPEMRLKIYCYLLLLAVCAYHSGKKDVFRERGSSRHADAIQAGQKNIFAADWPMTTIIIRDGLPENGQQHKYYDNYTTSHFADENARENGQILGTFSLLRTCKVINKELHREMFSSMGSRATSVVEALALVLRVPYTAASLVHAVAVDELFLSYNMDIRIDPYEDRYVEEHDQVLTWVGVLGKPLRNLDRTTFVCIRGRIDREHDGQDFRVSIESNERLVFMLMSRTMPEIRNASILISKLERPTDSTPKEVQKVVRNDRFEKKESGRNTFCPL